MTGVLAVIGMTALWLLYAWLACSIIASYLSERKGYGLKPGLASGLLLVPIGVLIWLVVPAREGSDWKVLGPVGRKRLDAADAELAKAAGPGGTPGPDIPGEVGTGR